MSIQAVILSGGLGTRLRAVNPEVPKPMVKVADRPFLEHLIIMLRRHGLEKFLFLLSYKSQVIIDFAGMLSQKMKIKIDWSVEPEPMGTGGAVKLAENKLETEFLLINGDSYLDMDYEGLVKSFRKSGLDAVMSIYDNSRNTNVINNVGVDRDGFVVKYKKADPDAKLSHVDAGVIAFKKEVTRLIPSGKVCSLENEIYQKLIDKKQFGSYVTQTRFYDIGTPERLKEFEGMVGR